MLYLVDCCGIIPSDLYSPASAVESMVPWIGVGGSSRIENGKPPSLIHLLIGKRKALNSNFYAFFLASWQQLQTRRSFMAVIQVHRKKDNPRAEGEL
jgi:hypothetical protein